MYGNNTISKGKHLTKSVSLIFIMVIVVSTVFSVIAVKNVTAITSQSSFHIESRFILWDDYEKMIDNEFSIHLYYINQSYNNTFTYSIIINYDLYEGINNTHHIQNISLSNNDVISYMEIKINNETLLKAYNIRIVSGVSSSGIKRSLSDFTISLSPFEWNAKERNIFYSVIVGALISLFLSFSIVKSYRMKYGIRIVED